MHLVGAIIVVDINHLPGKPLSLILPKHVNFITNRHTNRTIAAFLHGTRLVGGLGRGFGRAGGLG